MAFLAHLPTYTLTHLLNLQRQPVVDLDQEHMVGRRLTREQGAPITAEVEVTDALLAGAVLSPNQEEGRARDVFPAEYGITTQRAQGKVGIGDIECRRRPSAVGVDHILAGAFRRQGFLNRTDVAAIDQLFAVAGARILFVAREVVAR